MALAFLLGAIVVTLPSLAQHRAVKNSLVNQIKGWADGDVSVRGRIHVLSVFGLTIEASDIRLESAKRLGPISRVEAGSVRAVASLTALLRGKIKFKKATFISSKIYVRSGVKVGAGPGEELDALASALGLADASPYAELALRNATIVFEDENGKPSKSVFISRLSLTKPESGARKRPVSPGTPGVLTSASLLLKTPGLEASFRGQIDASAKSADGNFTMRISAAEPMADAIRAALFPWEEAQNVVLSSQLSLSPARIALDAIQIRFPERTANGSIALSSANRRLTLEGTLAYDTIDGTPLFPAPNGGKDGVARTLILSRLADRDGSLAAPDLDLRFSADRIGLPDKAGGPLALSLLSQRGHLSVDIAELGMFGGTIRGRIDYDRGELPSVVIKSSGEHIAVAALLAAFGPPSPLSGNAQFTLDFTARVISANHPVFGDSAGKFAISLPDGGAFGAPVSEQLAKALGDPGNWLTKSEVPFSELEIDGRIERNALVAALRGNVDQKGLSASVKIDLSAGGLDGKLTVTPSDSSAQADAGQIPPPVVAKIGGTLSAPEITLALPHLSN